MGMLNNFSQLLITKAFWSRCINFFVDFLGNYGWAIILFTIVLKLVLTPIDFIQRKSMKNQMKTQARLQPQMQKLQQQYGNDRAMLNQKMNELYQRNNISLKSTCLPMLVSLIVTSVVFFTLFGALNSIAHSKDSVIFNNVYKAYTSAETTIESNEYLESLEGLTDEQKQDAKTEFVNKAVLKEYKKQKDKHGFLWVQNVWKKDTTESAFVSYKEFKKYYEKHVTEISNETEFKNNFNEVKDILKSEYREQNGFFILIILAGAVTVLVQYLSQKSMAKSNGVQAQQTNKMMLFIMPLIMLIFASTSNALFTIYIITNSVISAVISKIIDLFLKDKDNNADGKQIVYKSNNVVEYSRNYKGN